MKTSLLLGVLLVCAAPLCAQPADTAPKLVNDLPFPLVAPEKAQQLAIPKPIVLNFDDAKLGTVLDELKKQTGVTFGLSNGNYEEQLGKKLSIHLETPSFTRAFGEIMDEAGLKAKLQDWGGNQNLQLIFNADNEEEKPLKSGVGLFGIALKSLNTNFSKSVNLANYEAPRRSENTSLQATLSLISDQRLPIIGSPQTRVTRAEDEQGRSLVPKPNGNERFQGRINRYSFYGNSSWEQKNARVELSPPAPNAKTLAHLEGVVIYALVTKIETWEVPDLFAAPQWARTFESGGETFAFKVEATPNADAEAGGLKVKIEVTSSNADRSYERVTYPLEQTEPLLASMYIEDANGMVLSNSGYSSSDGQTMKVGATFLPKEWETQEDDKRKPLQGPFKFVMKAPVEVVQTEVPFAFKNVPLP